MLPSKSCKTINANFLLKNFGLTFFDRFKTGTYLVNWFGRGSADQTWRFGGSAEPCRTSKFGRYQCRCRLIGRSLKNTNITVEVQSWIATKFYLQLIVLSMVEEIPQIGLFWLGKTTFEGRKYISPRLLDIKLRNWKMFMLLRKLLCMKGDESYFLQDHISSASEKQISYIFWNQG